MDYDDVTSARGDPLARKYTITVGPKSGKSDVFELELLAVSIPRTTTKLIGHKFREIFQCDDSMPTKMELSGAAETWICACTENVEVAIQFASVHGAFAVLTITDLDGLDLPASLPVFQITNASMERVSLCVRDFSIPFGFRQVSKQLAPSNDSIISEDYKKEEAMDDLLTAGGLSDPIDLSGEYGDQKVSRSKVRRLCRLTFPELAFRAYRFAFVPDYQTRTVHGQLSNEDLLVQ